LLGAPVALVTLAATQLAALASGCLIKDADDFEWNLAAISGPLSASGLSSHGR
jgi:hypothetical protein